MSNQRIKYNVFAEGDPREDQNNATCLPVSAHELELTFEHLGPTWYIICPEQGCIRDATNHDNGTCWVTGWFGNMGAEDMIYQSGVTVRFSIQDPYGVISDGPVVQVKDVIGFKGGVGYDRVDNDPQ